MTKIGTKADQAEKAGLIGTTRRSDRSQSGPSGRQTVCLLDVRTSELVPAEYEGANCTVLIGGLSAQTVRADYPPV